MSNLPYSDVALLEISGVPGECGVEGYSSCFELDSYDYSLHMQHTIKKAFGSSKSYPNVTSLSVSKAVGRASWAIQRLALAGAEQSEAVLSLCTVTEGKLVPYFKLRMAGAVLSGYSTRRQEGLSTESFRLSFYKMTAQYFENGTLVDSFTYDPQNEESPLS